MAGQACRQPPGYLAVPPLKGAVEHHRTAWIPGVDPDYERRQDWHLERNSIDLYKKQ
jgi:hypothetical protein